VLTVCPKRTVCALSVHVPLAVSAAGVYRTEDGGSTWQARNNGIRVVFMPEKYPEFG
jgi:hypothetical protein